MEAPNGFTSTRCLTPFKNISQAKLYKAKEVAYRVKPITVNRSHCFSKNLSFAFFIESVISRPLPQAFHERVRQCSDPTPCHVQYMTLQMKARPCRPQESHQLQHRHGNHSAACQVSFFGEKVGFNGLAISSLAYNLLLTLRFPVFPRSERCTFN